MQRVMFGVNAMHGLRQLDGHIDQHADTHESDEQSNRDSKDGTLKQRTDTVNKDAVATLKLGQARGIALLVPARAGLSVGEYAPNAVKKTVVGVGHAAKVQVDHMVRLHLPGVTIAGPDAADALAVAICHAHHLQSAGRLQAALRRASA